jgi:site-specific DNA-methyltransferase (adenine-specific)
MEFLIKTYTDENDMVLDNTMGSCSTGIACINTNRNFIGIENDKYFFDVSINRLYNKKQLKDFNLIIN